MASVQETAEQAIRDGLSDFEVLKRVLAVHPGAQTSTDAIGWYRRRLARAAEIAARAPEAEAEPATPAGRAIRVLLREGLPDYVVFKRTGAASLATVRAHRTRLIERGEDVPSGAEARRHWEELYGAPRRDVALAVSARAPGVRAATPSGQISDWRGSSGTS